MDSVASRIRSPPQNHIAASVVHIHKVMGTNPTDMKNTNGYRRWMILLYVEKTPGLDRITSIFRVELTIL